jgi:hypothetical protein
MRIKMALVLLFTALFSSQALAQWDWLSYPAPPPPPPPPSNESGSLTTLSQDARPSRPRERARPALHGSTQSDTPEAILKKQKLRKEFQKKKGKSVAKQQNGNKAPATGSATSSDSGGKNPDKPRSAISVEKTKATRATTAASAGTKAAVKPASQSGNMKKIDAESPSTASKSAQHENDLLRISSDAATNPAVAAFRNCIASYFARGTERAVNGTWADLLIRTTEGECRAQFDDMAHHLSERFGEGRAELVMQQLIETSLLPAAKAAASGNTGALSRPPK